MTRTTKALLGLALLALPAVAAIASHQLTPGHHSTLARAEDRHNDLQNPSYARVEDRHNDLQSVG
jgi:hypothetical protein